MALYSVLGLLATLEVVLTGVLSVKTDKSMAKITTPIIEMIRYF